MAAVPLTIPLEDFDHVRALGSWRWLTPPAFKPFLLTVFGDWVLGAPDGSIHFMDTIEGNVTRIAETGKEFNHGVDTDEAKRDEWLMEGLVVGQANRGVFLEKGQCFGFKTPPIIGGSFEAENIQPYDIVVYETITGQMLRQIKHPPTG